MKRKHLWFKKVRGSYLPCAWQGWLLYIPFVGTLILAVVVTVWQDRSLAGSIFDIFTRFIVITIAMHWIASRFSR